MQNKPYLQVQVVDIRRHGSQQVENVVARIIADDAFALDGRPHLDFLILLVEHLLC